MYKIFICFYEVSGQESQIVGMGKEFYDKFELVKSLFKEADETLNYSISKIILDNLKKYY